MALPAAVPSRIHADIFFFAGPLYLSAASFGTADVTDAMSTFATKQLASKFQSRFVSATVSLRSGGTTAGTTGDFPGGSESPSSRARSITFAKRGSPEMRLRSPSDFIISTSRTPSRTDFSSSANASEKSSR